MAAIAKVLSHAFFETQAEVGLLRTIITLCGAGLLVSLLLAAYGFDLSTGFL
jgi:hypothetical protein